MLSMPRRERIARLIGCPLLLIGLVSGLVLAPLAARALNSQLVWTRVAGLPVTARLHDVFMVDAASAYAVGENRGSGVVYQLRLDDGRWIVALEASASAPLRAVVAVDERTVWAVGDQGTIVHKDPAGWRVVPGSTPDMTLHTLQMFGSGEEGWAGGYLPATLEQGPQPVLLHYQAGQWRREPSLAGPGSVAKIHFAGPVGWAVGGGIWRYADGAWTRERAPDACGENFPCPHSFSAVRAVGADEAWAVGERHAICAVCVTRPLVVRRHNGAWQHVDGVPSGSTNPQSRAAFIGASFLASGEGLLVGWHDRGIVDPVKGQYDARIRPLVVRYEAGQWRQEALPAALGKLSAVSMVDGQHALVVGDGGLIMAYGYGAQPDPAARVPDPQLPGVLFFAPVGHTLGGAFRACWERNGGLAVFGYPLTEEFRELNSDTGQPYSTQYFERQRYEYHPDLRGTPYEVSLGRLGDEVLQRQGRDWSRLTKADPATAHFFVATGQAIAPEFWDYWRRHGLNLGDPGVSERESLALFGYPISPPQNETNSSGDRVLTQWFERARFEYHPTNPDPYKVLLGRLAAELLTERGW